MTNLSSTRRLSVAPMMDRTDRNFRLMMRAISRQTLLYTEMITTAPLLRGRAGPYQDPVDPLEHPVALQLGGDDPQDLAQCAKIGESLGYDEINLNVGCPSSRVQKGRIGAVLMRHPHVVAECVAQMRRAVSIPVTVKHRLGVDEDADEILFNFVDIVAQAGASHFIVHARKAWLNGLSPKENRDIPPLRYDLVHALARSRPDLHIEINGGLDTLEACQLQLQHVGSVMLGRAVWDHPMLLAPADALLFERPAGVVSRAEVVHSMLAPVAHLAQQRAWSYALRPLLNLFHGQPGGRAWRRILSEGAARRQDPRIEALILRALAAVDDHALAPDEPDAS